MNPLALLHVPAPNDHALDGAESTRSPTHDLHTVGTALDDWEVLFDALVQTIGGCTDRWLAQSDGHRSDRDSETARAELLERLEDLQQLQRLRALALQLWQPHAQGITGLDGKRAGTLMAFPVADRGRIDAGGASVRATSLNN